MSKKLSCRITTKVTPEIVKSVDNLASNFGVSRSNVIRMSLAFFLKNWGWLNESNEEIPES